jgi:hypothetical protein
MTQEWKRGVTGFDHSSFLVVPANTDTGEPPGVELTSGKPLRLPCRSAGGRRRF